MCLIADQRAPQINVLDVFSEHSENPVADYLRIGVWLGFELPSYIYLALKKAAEINLQLTNSTPQRQCHAHHSRLEYHTRQAPDPPCLSSHPTDIR